MCWVSLKASWCVSLKASYRGSWIAGVYLFLQKVLLKWSAKTDYIVMLNTREDYIINWCYYPFTRHHFLMDTFWCIPNYLIIIDTCSTNQSPNQFDDWWPNLEDASDEHSNDDNVVHGLHIVEKRFLTTGSVHHPGLHVTWFDWYRHITARSWNFANICRGDLFNI